MMACSTICGPLSSSQEKGEASICHSIPACGLRDRKSTRLNSSHVKSSYAVFCLKKKRSNASVFLVYYGARPTTLIYSLSLHDALPICGITFQRFLRSKNCSEYFSGGIIDDGVQHHLRSSFLQPGER